MSIEISVDEKSFDNLNKQFDFLKKKGETSLYKVTCMIAMRIKTTAQLRLKGQRHIKTSRLVNSVYMQAKDQAKADQYAVGKNPPTYSSDEGNFPAKMETIGLSDTEIAVGSNVKYAAYIEFGHPGFKIPNAFGRGKEVWHPGYKGDSYLNWAIQNVDISARFEKEMRDEMKFGAGVAAQQVKKVK